MTGHELNINTGSTGGLGLQRRSFDRYYLNYDRGVVESLDELQHLSHMGREAIRRRSNGVTRCVARVLIGERLLNQVIGVPELCALFEAAVPTGISINNGGRTSDRLWMLLGAVNSPERASQFPVNKIVYAVEHARRVNPETPVERVAQMRSEGYRFMHNIPRSRVEEILDLWGKTFDWDREGIVDLGARLTRERAWRPSDRGAWFTGLIDPETHELVSVATAERLNIPVGDSRLLPIVESTEWRRSGNVERHGLMAAAVSHLHAQVLEDLHSNNPLIIAETNYWSEAHRVGFAASMDVGPRNIGDGYVPQTLMQNVRVRDGHIPEGLRDFTMMFLPVESQEYLYSREQRAAILKEGAL